MPVTLRCPSGHSRAARHSASQARSLVFVHTEPSVWSILLISPPSHLLFIPKDPPKSSEETFLVPCSCVLRFFSCV